jgi:hypothetical protein
MTRRAVSARPGGGVESDEYKDAMAALKELADTTAPK